MIARLALALSLSFAAGCRSGVPTPATADRLCHLIEVVVTAQDGNGRPIAPGVPIDVLVRSQRGDILARTNTDDEGRAALEICWRTDDPPLQVEAKLHVGPQFVGSVASFYNYTDRYCLSIPERFGGHCGQWGTGSAFILDKR